MKLFDNIIYLISYIFVIQLPKIESQSKFAYSRSDCSNEEFYNSTSKECEKCKYKSDSKLNICYFFNEATKQIQSAYNYTKYYDCNDANRNCNCINGTEALVEKDENGNLLGRIICANTSVFLDDVDDNLTYYKNILGDNFVFSLSMLSNPAKIKLGMQSSQEDTTPTYFDSKELYYHYHSCKYGLVHESCQYLANLCTLSIYSKEHAACKAMELLQENFTDL